MNQICKCFKKNSTTKNVQGSVLQNSSQSFISLRHTQQTENVAATVFSWNKRQEVTAAG